MADVNQKEQAIGILRIEAENKRMEELYPKNKTLLNGIEVPGTYLDLGMKKGERFSYKGVKITKK